MFRRRGMPAENVVAALAERRDRQPHAGIGDNRRLCPGLLTPGNDIERTLAAVRTLA